jgi:hypothetical protein
VKHAVWIVLLAALGLALPTLKNAYLYVTYHHGKRGLERASGAPGDLFGMWVGTFDSFTCGMDERHRLRLVIETGGGGTLYHTMYADRVFGGGAIVYSWWSVLPYARQPWHHSEQPVEASAGELILYPQPEALYPDTVRMPFRIQGDSLLLAFAGFRADGEPQWGFPQSSQLAHPDDLIEWWGRW